MLINSQDISYVFLVKFESHSDESWVIASCFWCFFRSTFPV